MGDGEGSGGNAEETQIRTRSNHGGLDQKALYLGCLTKQQLIVTSVAVGLVVLLIVITVPAVLLSTSAPPAPLPSASTGGDMLDFLVQSGQISEPDALLATWFHRANSKEEMNKALAGDSMILEADVTLEGYGTPSVKPVPIMAHPPDVYSDNTLDQWLDAVLASRKGIKLDFKNLNSVGLSLDLLSQKNSRRGINQPVWLNADILQGPNVPDYLPVVNGTRFLHLIQQKFPNVTLSPGWKVGYAPPLFTKTYTKAMVEDMYNMIKDVPQKVTFPVHALLVQSGWQHLSWLLSQSPRFTLTLWQGSVHPNISDLLFVRDNTHPARVYYDIYEPTLSQFKQAARQRGRLRRFYPGGDLMDFLCPAPGSGAGCGGPSVRWFTVAGRASLLAQLSGGAGGVLVVRVASGGGRPGVPLVEGAGTSSEPLTLQDVLQLLGQSPEAPWGLYLQVGARQLLEACLTLLSSAYSRDQLYRPVWISAEGFHGDDTQEFLSTVDQLFPHVTLVLTQQSWPPRVPGTAPSQRAALHVSAASLPRGRAGLRALTEVMDSYDLIVEEDSGSGAEEVAALRGLAAQRAGRANTHLYVMSGQS